MNIIICCFKSCLKGENDREYYNVLELDPRCDHESIRKQYRKLSLVNHPVRYYLKPFLTFQCLSYLIRIDHLNEELKQLQGK